MLEQLDQWKDGSVTKQERWACVCRRMFTTKSGRTRHMVACPSVSDAVKDALRSSR